MKKEPKSSCCNAEIRIEEGGVSQLSFDPKFFCSKCGNEITNVEASQFNW